MTAEETGSALVRKLLDIGVDGIGPMKGAEDIADEHLRQHGSREHAIQRLIATHQRLLAGSGFATGVGGAITLPIAIPTDLTVLYLQQARLVAAIAHLRGYDVKSDEVRSVILLTLLGSTGAGIATSFGIELGNKLAMSALKQIPGKVFIEINKKVGFRLVTKAGTKGLVNMTKLIPLAGGIVGAGVNVASTSSVAGYAKRNFPSSGGAEPNEVLVGSAR